MPERKGEARWEGDLKSGEGHFSVGSGALEGNYSFKTRFEEGEQGTNPEELIGAAHAACFSMALSHRLAEAGHTPTSVQTTARVSMSMGDDGPAINKIKLATEGVVPGVDDATFQEHARAAKEGCPVSRALAGVDIQLEATLRG